MGLLSFSAVTAATTLLLLSLLSSGQSASLNGLESRQLYKWSYPSQDDVASNSSLRCGDTLTDNSNGIIYKPFEAVLPNERCVWIIGVPGAVGYDINVMYLGDTTNKREDGQGLAIDGIHHTGIFFDSPTFISYDPTTLGQFRVENSSIIILTFYSSSVTANNSRGFILEYNSIFEGNVTGRTESTHQIAGNPTYEFKYPPGGNYTSEEFAAFAFPPKDNFFTPNHVEHVSFRVYGLDRICYDSLTLYSFNVSAPIGANKWTFIERICKESESLLFPHDDVALAFFQSDASVNDVGIGYSVFGC